MPYIHPQLRPNVVQVLRVNFSGKTNFTKIAFNLLYGKEMFLKTLCFALIFGCVAADKYRWGERGPSDTLLGTYRVMKYCIIIERQFYATKTFSFPNGNRVCIIFL